MKNAALAIFLCGMFVLPAKADTISGGRITSVEAGGAGFSYLEKEKALEIQNHRQDRHSGRRQNRQSI
jgi:hypothetical protein